MANKTAEQVHTLRVLMIIAPFLFVLAIYPVVYVFFVRRHTPSKRKTKMIRKFQVMNKIIAA